MIVAHPGLLSYLFFFFFFLFFFFLFLFLFCIERYFMMCLSHDTQAGVIKAFNSTSRYLDDLLNIDNPNSLSFRTAIE